MVVAHLNTAGHLERKKSRTAPAVAVSGTPSSREEKAAQGLKIVRPHPFVPLGSAHQPRDLLADNTIPTQGSSTNPAGDFIWAAYPTVGSWPSPFPRGEALNRGVWLLASKLFLVCCFCAFLCLFAFLSSDFSKACLSCPQIRRNVM